MGGRAAGRTRARQREHDREACGRCIGKPGPGRPRCHGRFGKRAERLDGPGPDTRGLQRYPDQDSTQGADGRSRSAPPDRVRQRRQSHPRAQQRAPPRDGDAPRARRVALAPGPAAPGGVRDSVGRRLRCGSGDRVRRHRSNRGHSPGPPRRARTRRTGRRGDCVRRRYFGADRLHLRARARAGRVARCSRHRAQRRQSNRQRPRTTAFAAFWWLPRSRWR